MKLRIGLTVAMLAVASSSAIWAQGQVATGAAGVNAPASAVTFSPAIQTGAHSLIEKQIGTGTKKAETKTGPYVTPSLSVDYKGSDLTLGLSYEVEINALRGFGSAAKSISDNAFLDHHPVVAASTNILDGLKINALLDSHFRFYNGDEKQNNSEIFFNPDVEQQLTPSTSVAAGYVLHRTENFDNQLGAKADDKAGILAAINVSHAGEDKLNTLHAGVITLKNKIGDQKLSTYIRAGRRIGNTPDVTAYSYRFQTNLDYQSPIKALTGVLRYRFNVENQDTAEIQYYNLGRITASYALSPNWSLELFNEIVLSQDTRAAKKAILDNENYLGVSYKF